MQSEIDRVVKCIDTRSRTAAIIGQTIRTSEGKTELELSEQLQVALSNGLDVYPEGWYSPPPAGVGVLYADAGDKFARSKFPSLRQKAYWPSSEQRLSRETVGMVYVSPVDKTTGVIADIGCNFYRGADFAVQSHLATCLSTIERIAEEAVVGMRFSDLHARAEALVAEGGLHNNWMVTVNDPTGGADYGHVFPWTYEQPTAAEQVSIDTYDFAAIKHTIEKKRLFINPIDSFVIPDTVAFSLEARLGNKTDPSLPCGYYYMLVTFQAGRRQIFSHLNPIFEALDITYMRSRYE